ncbi:Fanconi anemia group B protein [Carcharodon carcharias]|uniref:Fanconi anemia group B protein n=1 Tax=Carcharodon carcharias TaxID=13397 RepID=UPI001B7DA027|nr:Fanconi anemia group B protein [Carcharodon carcharias]XP_041066521.1 Fanconi anemia group B protein [Carcharodon carcharias]
MELESIKKTVNVTTLTGEVISFIMSKEKHPGGKNDAVLMFKRMTFDSETGKFIQKFSGKFNPNQGSSFLQIVTCCCAIDSRTGQNAPCILLKKHKKAHSKFGYSLLMLHSSNEIEHCLDFELEYEMKENVTLLAGPRVFWSSGDQVHYVSCETKEILNIPISFTVVKWIGEIFNEDVIVLGVRRTVGPVKNDETSVCHADKLIWGSEFVTYSLQKKENFCSYHVIPHAYSSVVTNILICPFEEINNQLKTTVVASTCKKQLVLFENCVPKNVCQLPFEETSEIKMVTTGRENCLFLVSSKAGHVCAVSKESWQIAVVWQKIWSVQLDDFLGRGTEQILLLSMAASTVEDCFKDFVLTDLGEFRYTVNSGHAEDKGVRTNDAAHVNYHHTIQALEARLQSGLASLEELQQLLRAKERVLLQSSKALTNLIEGKQSTLPSAEEEGLVSLWHEEEPVLKLLVEEACPTNQALNHPVQRVWQRVVDGIWIVGVQLSESVSLNFDCVSLSLVMDHDLFNAAPVLQSQSRVLKLNKSQALPSFPKYPTEPPLKKPRLEMKDVHNLSSCCKEDLCFQIDKDLTQTITVVTNLSPLLAYNNIHCSVLLHCTMTPIQKTELTKREMIIPCGRVYLNLEDIWNEKYAINLLWNPLLSTDNAVEDFYTTVAISRRSSFKIFSPNYTLAQVKEWLLGPMQCAPLKICPKYLLCSKRGPLQSMLLNWYPQNPFKGILIVLCRNQSSLLMFLHGLIRVLPQGCVITHMSTGTEDRIADILGCALEQETLAFRNIITSAISETENEFTVRAKTERKQNILPSTPLLDSEEGIQEYREKFQIEQEQSTLGMHLSITGFHYREITKKLTDMQLNTDSSAWRLSRFHSSVCI